VEQESKIVSESAGVAIVSHTVSGPQPTSISLKLTRAAGSKRFVDMAHRITQCSQGNTGFFIFVFLVPIVYV
jgi:hypothetical protein